MKNKTDDAGTDLAKLLITGLVCSIVLFGGYAFIFLNIEVSYIWQMFICGCLIFVFIALYMTNSSLSVKALWKGRVYKVLILIAGVIAIPILLFYYLFRYGVLPMPSYLIPYSIGAFVLAVIVNVLLDWILKKLGWLGIDKGDR